MKTRGLTLLELMIALAMLALAATVAMPSFGQMSQRARLKAAAETLSADLAEARFQAAERGLPLHLVPKAGDGWCWAVATAPGCDCTAKAQCTLKRTLASDHAGVQLVEAHAIRLDAVGRAHPDDAPTAGHGDGTTAGTLLAAEFQSPGGLRLRVAVSALGRAGICAPAGAVAGYPGC